MTGFGKVILVKTQDDYPKLIPVTALKYDGTTETVKIDREVTIDGVLTTTVPKHRCFEFDADLMEHVNALTDGGLMKISAAQQLCDSGLEPAEFITDGNPGKLIAH